MFSRDSLWTVHVWSFTKFCHTLLISPLPLQPNMRIEHVTGKPAQYPRRMWKLRHSSVQWSVAHRPICLSMSEFCHALCLGDNKRNGCFFFLLWIRPFRLPTLQSNSVNRPFIGTTEYFQIKDIQYCQLIMCPVCVLLNISTAAFLLSPVALAHVICKCFYSAFISIKSTPQIKPQLSVPLCCNQRSPIWLWWARKSKPPKRGESRALERMIRWLYWPGE